jgi:hypothetical protein
MRISEPRYPATPKPTPEKVYPEIIIPKNREELRRTGFYFRKRQWRPPQPPSSENLDPPCNATAQQSTSNVDGEQLSTGSCPHAERIRDEACENLIIDYNEPLAFREMRVITASESCWLLFEFPQHETMYKVKIFCIIPSISH